MSGSAPPRTRAPSRPFDATDSSFSYSYDSSSRSSSLSSCSSLDSSSSSSYTRRGRRRQRSRSPVLADNPYQHRRLDAVLDYENDAVLSSCGLLPSVLGGADVPKDLGGVLDTPGRPAGDWACGVCSNINSQEREGCYRCGCNFAESLLATPTYEVSATRIPPGVSASAVEQALRATLPEGTSAYLCVDTVTAQVFVQFASVEEATKYLVGQRCEVVVASGVAVRLGFALMPHPQRREEDVVAEAARASEASEKAKTHAALVAAGVPRFLWPETWRPPTAFPTVEKQRAFLSAMSAHWDHLSEEQRRYYEAEVRRVLQKATPTTEVKAKESVSKDAVATAPLEKKAEQQPVATTSPPSTTATTTATTAESPLKGSSGATSHALDGLKKRLAERKMALKKTEGVSNTASAASLSTTPNSASTTSRAGNTPGGTITPGSSGSGFPASPPCDLARVQTWGGFPLPLQYAAPAEVPRTVELARVPMSVCERLLPPALLQVVRQQFR